MLPHYLFIHGLGMKLCIVRDLRIIRESKFHALPDQRINLLPNICRYCFFDGNTRQRNGSMLSFFPDLTQVANFDEAFLLISEAVFMYDDAQVKFSKLYC